MYSNESLSLSSTDRNLMIPPIDQEIIKRTEEAIKIELKKIKDTEKQILDELIKQRIEVLKYKNSGQNSMPIKEFHNFESIFENKDINNVNERIDEFMNSVMTTDSDLIPYIESYNKQHQDNLNEGEDINEKKSPNSNLKSYDYDDENYKETYNCSFTDTCIGSINYDDQSYLTANSIQNSPLHNHDDLNDSFVTASLPIHTSSQKSSNKNLKDSVLRSSISHQEYKEYNDNDEDYKETYNCAFTDPINFDDYHSIINDIDASDLNINSPVNISDIDISNNNYDSSTKKSKSKSPIQKYRENYDQSRSSLNNHDLFTKESESKSPMRKYKANYDQPGSSSKNDNNSVNSYESQAKLSIASSKSNPIAQVNELQAEALTQSSNANEYQSSIKSLIEKANLNSNLNVESPNTKNEDNGSSNLLFNSFKSIMSSSKQTVVTTSSSSSSSSIVSKSNSNNNDNAHNSSYLYKSFKSMLSSSPHDSKAASVIDSNSAASIHSNKNSLPSKLNVRYNDNDNDNEFVDAIGDNQSIENQNKYSPITDLYKNDINGSNLLHDSGHKNKLFSYSKDQNSRGLSFNETNTNNNKGKQKEYNLIPITETTYSDNDDISVINNNEPLLVEDNGSRKTYFTVNPKLLGNKNTIPFIETRKSRNSKFGNFSKSPLEKNNVNTSPRKLGSAIGLIGRNPKDDDDIDESISSSDRKFTSAIGLKDKSSDHKLIQNVRNLKSEISNTNPITTANNGIGIYTTNVGSPIRASSPICQPLNKSPISNLQKSPTQISNDIDNAPNISPKPAARPINSFFKEKRHTIAFVEKSSPKSKVGDLKKLFDDKQEINRSTSPNLPYPKLFTSRSPSPVASPVNAEWSPVSNDNDYHNLWRRKSAPDPSILLLSPEDNALKTVSSNSTFKELRREDAIISRQSRFNGDVSVPNLFAKNNTNLPPSPRSPRARIGNNNYLNGSRSSSPKRLSSPIRVSNINSTPPTLKTFANLGSNRKSITSNSPTMSKDSTISKIGNTTFSSGNSPTKNTNNIFNPNLALSNLSRLKLNNNDNYNSNSHESLTLSNSRSSTNLSPKHSSYKSSTSGSPTTSLYISRKGLSNDDVNITSTMNQSKVEISSFDKEDYEIDYNNEEEDKSKSQSCETSLYSRHELLSSSINDNNIENSNDDNLESSRTSDLGEIRTETIMSGHSPSVTSEYLTDSQSLIPSNVSSSRSEISSNSRYSSPSRYNNNIRVNPKSAVGALSNSTISGTSSSRSGFHNSESESSILTSIDSRNPAQIESGSRKFTSSSYSELKASSINKENSNVRFSPSNSKSSATSTPKNGSLFQPIASLKNSETSHSHSQSDLRSASQLSVLNDYKLRNLYISYGGSALFKPGSSEFSERGPYTSLQSRNSNRDDFKNSKSTSADSTRIRNMDQDTGMRMSESNQEKIIRNDDLESIALKLSRNFDDNNTRPSSSDNNHEIIEIEDDFDNQFQMNKNKNTVSDSGSSRAPHSVLSSSISSKSSIARSIDGLRSQAELQMHDLSLISKPISESSSKNSSTYSHSITSGSSITHSVGTGTIIGLTNSDISSSISGSRRNISSQPLILDGTETIISSANKLSTIDSSSKASYNSNDFTKSLSSEISASRNGSILTAKNDNGNDNSINNEVVSSITQDDSVFKNINNVIEPPFSPQNTKTTNDNNKLDPYGSQFNKLRLGKTFSLKGKRLTSSDIGRALASGIGRNEITTTTSRISEENNNIQEPRVYHTGIPTLFGKEKPITTGFGFPNYSDELKRINEELKRLSGEDSSSEVNTTTVIPFNGITNDGASNENINTAKDINTGGGYTELVRGNNSYIGPFGLYGDDNKARFDFIQPENQMIPSQQQELEIKENFDFNKSLPPLPSEVSVNKRPLPSPVPQQPNFLGPRPLPPEPNTKPLNREMILQQPQRPFKTYDDFLRPAPKRIQSVPYEEPNPLGYMPLPIVPTISDPSNNMSPKLHSPTSDSNIALSPKLTGYAYPYPRRVKQVLAHDKSQYAFKLFKD